MFTFRPILILIIFLTFLNIQGQQNQADSLIKLIPQKEGEDRVQLLAKLAYMHLSGSTEESEKFVRQLRDYSQEIGYLRGEALADNIQGLIFYRKGNYRNALNNFEEALNYFQSIEDSSAISQTYNNVALCYHELGEFQRAISFYQNSSDIAKTRGDQHGLCRTVINMGTVYSDWGKTAIALENFHYSLAIAKEIPYDKYIAISLLNIGNNLRKLKKYDSVLYYFESSLEIREKNNDEQGVFNVLINKGEFYLDINDSENAILQFEMALAKAKELSNDNNIAEASLNLGKAFLFDNQFPEAERNLNTALNLARKLDDQKMIQESYKALSDYYQQVGKFQDALRYYQYYTAVKDSAFTADSRKDLAEMQTLYEMDKKEQELENQNLKNKQLQLRFYITILGVLLILLIAWLLFNRFKLRQKHFRTELERKNIEIEQRLLRTQMNPHFIFNSLNSINSFVIDNNVDAAQSFLSKFAKLMRAILENSRMEIVSVEEEITALRLNFELEQLRFDNKFDFIIELDENIEDEFTYIPPMLIQPFIENAILHGMANIGHQGLIRLNIKIRNKLFLCEVIDNGIGRAASSRFKKVSGGKKRKSLGMQVTRERLEMLAHKFKNPQIGFRIIDLKDKNGEAQGTRVELYIPFEEE